MGTPLVFADLVRMAHQVRDEREIELKFELDSGAARELRRHSFLAKVAKQTQSQSTVYFDTKKGKLHRRGYSLRVRQVGDCLTQTVKTNGSAAGLFNRGEWETPVEQMAPDRKALKRTPLGKLRKLDRKVGPVVCSDVERTTWMVDRDQSITEVVLDSGTISCGNQETSFHELELELRAGEPATMFDIAQELGQLVPLNIGVLSKEERGLMLATGAAWQEQRSSAMDVHKGMNVGQVFALIVHECIRHFRLNEAPIIADRNPKALHQARVAIRRLRAAFDLFRPAIRQGSLELLRKELREFISPFGEARNLDVFLDTRGHELGWRDRRKVRSACAQAYDQVIDRLNAQRSREMLVDLVEWTSSGEWRKDDALGPISPFAAARLDAARRRVIHRGKGLSDLEEKQLHKLRISIKRLRYAADFLGPLYSGKPVRRFSSSLKGLQDCLGFVHDGMVGRQIVAELSLDETGRSEIADRSRQLKELAARFRCLKRIDRFWDH